MPTGVKRKEKGMVQKKFLMGMLVMSLVFAMTAVGCPEPEGNGNGNNSNGESLPAASGANAVSGKTYFIGSYTYSSDNYSSSYISYNNKTVFSTTAAGASSGTYTKESAVYNYNDGYVLSNGKYTYETSATGTYTWNEGAKTVTIKPEKIAWENENGQTVFSDKTAYRNAYHASLQVYMNEYKAEMGEAGFNTWLAGEGFSSVAAYINYTVDYAVEEVFKNRTYTYSFSADNVSLFLREALPANKGANELSGQTYNGFRGMYTFTATSYTFTSGSNTEEGEYAYDNDSHNKRVFFSPAKINGKTMAEYYDVITISEHRFENDTAYRAAQTNAAFGLRQMGYNSTNKTIDW